MIFWSSKIGKSGRKFGFLKFENWKIGLENQGFLEFEKQKNWEKYENFEGP